MATKRSDNTKKKKKTEGSEFQRTLWSFPRHTIGCPARHPTHRSPARHPRGLAHPHSTNPAGCFTKPDRPARCHAKVGKKQLPSRAKDDERRIYEKFGAFVPGTGSRTQNARNVTNRLLRPNTHRLPEQWPAQTRRRESVTGHPWVYIKASATMLRQNSSAALRGTTRPMKSAKKHHIKNANAQT
jgi:hypothetical protein